MISNSPPRWLQFMLSLFLNVRDRETVAGDLLEEYREEQRPRLGAWRAGYWYFRQVVSLGFVRMLAGPVLRQALISICVFAMVAGTWLGVMENVLKHDGYAGRTVTAACVVAQGMATLLYMRLRGGTVFRYTVMTGAVAILLLGAGATVRILQSPHFEGFVLIIGVALMLQGALTLAALWPTQYRPAARL